jgi:hypothetical protein
VASDDCPVQAEGPVLAAASAVPLPVATVQPDDAATAAAAAAVATVVHVCVGGRQRTATMVQCRQWGQFWPLHLQCHFQLLLSR